MNVFETPNHECVLIKKSEKTKQKQKPHLQILLI